MGAGPTGDGCFAKSYASFLSGQQWGTAFLVSIFGVLITIGWAAISWHYFEKPLVKLGHRHQYQTNNREKRSVAARRMVVLFLNTP
jgi:peptidoglycan/LPS O-acetylase OafA/YrhL